MYFRMLWNSQLQQRKQKPNQLSLSPVTNFVSQQLLHLLQPPDQTIDLLGKFKSNFQQLIEPCSCCIVTHSCLVPTYATMQTPMQK